MPGLVRDFTVLASSPGAIARLRALTLSLAVQGKLVRQNAADSPANVLLAQIRAEVGVQVIATQQDSAVADAPFEIPSSWEWVTLGEVVDVIRGITFPANEKTKEPAPNRIACLRTTNVQHALEWDDLLFVDRSFMGREEQLVRHHDIVMSMANSRELVGKVALVEQVPREEATFGAFLGVLRPCHSEPRYVMAVLRTAYSRAALIGSASQTTNIANISLGKLRPLPFPLPPLAEQHRIVARVEELMKLCDALEQSGRLADEQHARLTSTLFDALSASESAHALAENWQRVAEHFDLLLDRPEAIDALEQTMLQLAVRGLLAQQDETDEPASTLLHRLRAEQDRMIAMGQIRREKVLPQLLDEDCPFDLPVGWRWARLGELANFIDYRGRTPVKTSSGVPLITAKNVRQGFINREPREFIASDAYDDWMTRGFPRVGDLLFTTEAPLGNVAPIDIAERFALAQRVICFGLYEVEMSGVLSVFLQSPWMQDAFAAQATGVTAQGIKSARLQLIPIPVPPLPEQHRIVARVEELRHLCAQLRERLFEAQRTQSQLADALVAQAVV